MTDVIQHPRVPGNDTLPSNCDLATPNYNIHERTLDLAARIALKGHRLRIRAEKAA